MPGMLESSKTRGNGRPAVARFVETGERRYAAVNGLGPHLPAAQHLEENQPVHGVVVHDQHGEILQRSRGGAGTSPPEASRVPALR